MWKKSETYNKDKPLEIDNTSSSYVTYIRRNIEQIEEYDDVLEMNVKKWVYEENIISKEVADIIIENTVSTEVNAEGIDDIATIIDEQNVAINDLAEALAEME